jgi:hypothetical protein
VDTEKKHGHPEVNEGNCRGGHHFSGYLEENLTA